MILRRAVFLLPVLIAGCIFSTRAPQPPVVSNTFLWTPATTPDFLLENFTGTLKLLDASDYMRVFISASDSGESSKSYTFSPSPGLDAPSRSIFTVWSVPSEGAWLAKLETLLPANSELSITLSNPAIDEVSGSISEDYAISIPTPASSATVLPSLVQGTLQMQCAQVTTQEGTKEWRIVSWSDYPSKNGTGPTWSDLKAKLS